MKKIKLSVAVLLTAFVLSGCFSANGSFLSNMPNAGTTTTTSPTTATTSSSTGSSLLGNLLGTILGTSATLTQADIQGTWSYQSADCVFETENFLLKAGGEVAATKLETSINENLSKIGITSSSCSFTFNNDNTYTAVFAGRSISGNYTLDTENKKITMTYLGGLGTMTPHIAKNGSTLSLLYEADKLLGMVNTIASLSGNSNLQTLANLANQYDGMMVGMELQK